MKFLHLSDLHIGKRMYEFSLLEDQRRILAQILSIAEAEKPDGVFISGDVYDKPTPPAEAVQVFDGFLTALVKMEIQVFLINGNHDSAERLAFGGRIFEGQGVHVAPVYDGTLKRVELKDEYGPLTVWLLPFIKPALVRHAFLEAEVTSHNEAVRLALDYACGNEKNESCKTAGCKTEGRKTESRKAVKTRNVLLAHQFVTGAARCESEEIFVGGLDNVDASLFDDFDYVALGHIHSPQSVGRSEVRYCGTPLKYSFSEAEQEKSVTIVTLKQKGETEIRTIPLTPYRDVRKIRGTYMEVTARSFYEGMNLEDYLQITLTDEENIPDGMQKLRAIYKNLMRLEYDNRRTRENREILADERQEEKSELELFEEFYQLQNNSPMSEEQRDFSGKLIGELKEREEL